MGYALKPLCPAKRVVSIWQRATFASVQKILSKVERAGKELDLEWSSAWAHPYSPYIPKGLCLHSFRFGLFFQQTNPNRCTSKSANSFVSFVMVLIGGKIVLLDPHRRQSSKESSSFSIGHMMKQAIIAHNETLAEKDDVNRLEFSCTPRKYSVNVMNTVGRKLQTSRLFAKHIGKRSFRVIKNSTEPHIFNTAVEQIVLHLNEKHRLLAYTEGDWGAVKCITQKLRNMVAHCHAAGKLASNRKGRSVKSQCVRQQLGTSSSKAAESSKNPRRAGNRSVAEKVVCPKRVIDTQKEKRGHDVDTPFSNDELLSDGEAHALRGSSSSRSTRTNGNEGMGRMKERNNVRKQTTPCSSLEDDDRILRNKPRRGNLGRKKCMRLTEKRKLLDEEVYLNEESSSDDEAYFVRNTKGQRVASRSNSHGLKVANDIRNVSVGNLEKDTRSGKHKHHSSQKNVREHDKLTDALCEGIVEHAQEDKDKIHGDLQQKVHSYDEDKIKCGNQKGKKRSWEMAAKHGENSQSKRVEKEKSDGTARKRQRNSVIHHKCTIANCTMSGATAHICRMCERPMHNLCGMRALGEAYVEVQFICSLKCLGARLRQSIQN